MMYEPNWESLRAYTVPEWFKDAKLGIFIHWGVYAVPAFDNEWYPRFMYRDEISRKGPNYFQHHRQRYGPQSEFGYKDFVPMFKAENWDPEAWIARLDTPIATRDADFDNDNDVDNDDFLIFEDLTGKLFDQRPGDLCRISHMRSGCLAVIGHHVMVVV